MIIKLSFIMFIIATSSIALLYKSANNTPSEKEYPTGIKEAFITLSLLVIFAVSSFIGVCLL